MREKLTAIGTRLIAWRFPIITALVAVAVFVTVAAVMSTPEKKVLVATKTISAGELIDETNTAIEPRYPDFAQDAVVELSKVRGKRTLVDIEQDAIVRAAYVEEVHLADRMDVLALPVSDDVARLFAKGDVLDVYGPADCPPDNIQCPAKLLTKGARVQDVISSKDSQWSATQNATLVIGIKPKDTTLVAGVTDSAALTLVRVSRRNPEETLREDDPKAAPDQVAPTGVPDRVTPTGMPDGVNPKGAPHRGNPEGMPEGVNPNGTPHRGIPEGAPEVEYPDNTPGEEAKGAAH